MEEGTPNSPAAPGPVSPGKDGSVAASTNDRGSYELIICVCHGLITLLQTRWGMMNHGIRRQVL